MVSRGVLGRDVEEDTAFVAGLVPEAAGDAFDLLITRFPASVLALVILVIRNASISGHQVSMVVASRLVSGMSAVAQVS